MRKTEFEIRYEILMKEWDYTQTKIGRFDTIVFQIRSWAITSLAGLLAVAVTQHKPSLMIFGIFITLLFLLNDAVQKSFQRSAIARCNEIEAYLGGESLSIDISSEKFSGIEFPKLILGTGTLTNRLRFVLEACKLNNVIIFYGALEVFGIICTSFCYYNEYLRRALVVRA